MSKEILEIDQNGVLINDPSLIVKAFHSYYLSIFVKVIYTGNTKDFESLLSIMPSLNKDSKTIIGGPITLSEVKAAIDFLQNGKTQAPDGLSGEFY